MRLIQAFLCTLLFVLVRSKGKSDYTCAHDGYSNDDGKCECTYNVYNEKQFNFYSGSKCNDIECTNSGVRISDEDDESNQRCACPPGFLGTHCEPTHCVPGELQSFNELSHGRDVAVIITYNKEFQEQVLNKDKNDNLPKTICDAIKAQKGITEDSKIHFWFIETDISTNVKDCVQDVNVALSLCTAIDDGKKVIYSCEGDLKVQDISDALETMGEDSRLIILSNEGIKDNTDEEGIEAIRKKAISLRTQIHSIVLSPRDPNPDTIYFKDPGYKLLRDLSESTLGFFITPFSASGGQIIGKDGMTSILNKMMSVFFEYVVVDRITTNTTSCTLASDFTVFKTMEPTPDWQFWLTVTSNGANYITYDTAWIGADVEIVVDGGFFKGYNLPAVFNQSVALKPVNKMGNKCVPTTIMVLAKSQHLARFAITDNDAIDASSPFAISGAEASNTLVGHFVNYYHEDHLKSLYLEFSNMDDFQADPEKEPLLRDCQYNAKFSDVSCTEGKNTLIRVRNKESGDAVTVQSLYCSGPDTTSALRSQQDRVSFDSSAATADCTPSNIIVKKAQRTLILAAHATNTIYKLFNGNSKSAIRYLNDLADTDHYDSYVVNIFNATDVTEAQSSTEYEDFKANLMDRWNNVYGGNLDVDCKAEVEPNRPIDAILPLMDILSSGTITHPNSDIIYIFDRAIKDVGNDADAFNAELKTLQRQMYQKRLRLIVLLLGCDKGSEDFSDSIAIKQWNGVATKTGGFMVHFEEPEDLNAFLASYVDWVKGETAASIDGKDMDGMLFSFNPVTSTPFQVQEGRNYTILVNTLPPLPQVNVSLDSGVEIIDRTNLLGNSLSIFEYQAKADGVLAVKASPSPYFYYSSIRVLEVTDDDFATIGFTDSTCLNSEFPDLNPKKLQYPITSTAVGASVNMTIFTSDGDILRNGVATDLESTSYPLNDYNWKCNDGDHVFYISSDVVTESSTFTRAITTQCFGSGDDRDKCINGKYVDPIASAKTGTCDCPHEYTGDLCEQPVCQNGGVITASLECDCTGTDYEGDFCQKYKLCTGREPFTPQYRSIANTIIFLVEKSKFVVDRIAMLTDPDLFKDVRAAQYLIVEYGPDDASNYTIRISTTDKDVLYHELTDIKELKDDSTPGDALIFDAIPAIKAALQAQTTDSAHIFWFAQDDSVDSFETELFEPIANNRVTITAFFGASVVDPVTNAPVLPVHPVTLTAGSIFYSSGRNDYVDLFNKYVIAILNYEFGFEHRPNVLSISTEYNAVHTINVDTTVTALFVATDSATSIELQQGEAPKIVTITGADFPGGKIYDQIDAGEYKVVIKHSDELTNRTSSVIALTQNQVAYGFYRSDESDIFMDSAMMGNNVLVTYWLSEGTANAPSAVITPLTLDGAGESVEMYMTVRDQCSYTLSLPINCTGEADAYGVKITNSIITSKGKSEWKVDKYIPVLCLSSHFCHNGGTPTDDGCECGYFYAGLYCEIDKCTNGEKTDGKCVCNTGYSGEFCDTFTKPADRTGVAFLFIQDVCGDDEKLKDDAQSVFASYLPLLKSTDKVYLATNEKGSDIQPVTTADLQKALDANRAAAGASCEPTIGDALDAFYDALRKQSSASFAAEAAADTSVGKANVAHVTTVPVNNNLGADLKRLETDYNFNMEFVGITEKNVYFTNPEVFDIFPGEFLQTYDTEVALLDLVNTFGSSTKPVIPSGDTIPRCIKNLQAAFAFHTDISSVPRMKEFRDKAQKVIQSVTKYFTIPDVKTIDMDDDTCEYNRDQMENKSLFTGTIYANNSAIGVPNFCTSNMASYPGTITSADYKQADQVNLQSVIDSYTKWYNTPQKMMCHCFDYDNPNTTAIILWTPLSPTSLDKGAVSFKDFDKVAVGKFKHIVMPFGFGYKESSLWRSLVPDQTLWINDASDPTYEVDDIIQDIWSITCRLAGHIEGDQTAEPFNPYTTKKPRVSGEDSKKDDSDVTDETPTDSPVGAFSR